MMGFHYDHARTDLVCKPVCIGRAVVSAAGEPGNPAEQVRISIIFEILEAPPVYGEVYRLLTVEFTAEAGDDTGTVPSRIEVVDPAQMAPPTFLGHREGAGSLTGRADSSATIVFPDPTSPCSSLAIGISSSRSSTISESTDS